MTVPIIETQYGARLGTVEFVWAVNSREFVFSNSIVIHDKPAIVVDPSANFSYLEGLASQKKIDWVVNTHYHGDHRSLNPLFKGLPLSCHEADAPAIADYDTYETYADRDKDSVYAVWRKEIFSHLGIQHQLVSQTFKDGDTVALRDGLIEWVHLPGHTPGHTGLFFPHLRCLFIADIDLTPYGPWYANEVSNIEQFLASIRRIRAIEADYYVTSHGERIYTPEQFFEKLDRFAAHFSERDEKIIEKLKQRSRSLNDLCYRGIVYRKPSTANDPLKAYFEQQMIRKHLERFLEKRIVAYNDQEDVYYLP